jgi:hypothetical protein
MNGFHDALRPMRVTRVQDGRRTAPLFFTFGQ